MILFEVVKQQSILTVVVVTGFVSPKIFPFSAEFSFQYPKDQPKTKCCGEGDNTPFQAPHQINGDPRAHYRPLFFKKNYQPNE